VILVDTSVLIAFLKGSAGEAPQKFRTILQQSIPFGITPLIMQEVLQGAAGQREFDVLSEVLASQRFLYCLRVRISLPNLTTKTPRHQGFSVPLQSFPQPIASRAPLS
jgi:predicted nucleic acid-binding protein